MYCSWIKAYDAPTGGNRVNPMFLHDGDIIYLDISTIPAGYEFLGWKDLDGNALDEDTIHEVEGGRYEVKATCSGSFIANFKVDEEDLCVVKFTTNNHDATLVIDDDDAMWDVEVEMGNNPDFDVKTPEGCCFTGWIDTEEGVYLQGCDRPETPTADDFDYLLIPSEYVDHIRTDMSGRILEMNDTDFIDELENKDVPQHSNTYKFIYNEDTEELRQIVWKCEEEAYDVDCGSEIKAMVSCGTFEETKECDDAVEIESEFENVYGFLQKTDEFENLNWQCYKVIIKGEDRYYMFTPCPDSTVNDVRLEISYAVEGVTDPNEVARLLNERVLLYDWWGWATERYFGGTPERYACNVLENDILYNSRKVETTEELTSPCRIGPYNIYPSMVDPITGHTYPYVIYGNSRTNGNRRPMWLIHSCFNYVIPEDPLLYNPYIEYSYISKNGATPVLQNVTGVVSLHAIGGGIDRGVYKILMYFKRAPKPANVQFSLRSTAAVDQATAAEDLNACAAIFDDVNDPNHTGAYGSLTDPDNPDHIAEDTSVYNSTCRVTPASTSAGDIEAQWPYDRNASVYSEETSNARYGIGDTVNLVAGVWMERRGRFVRWEITTHYELDPSDPLRVVSVYTQNPLTTPPLGEGTTRIVAVYEPSATMRYIMGTSDQDIQSRQDLQNLLDGYAFVYDNSCGAYNSIVTDPDHYADNYIGYACQLTPVNISLDMIISSRKTDVLGEKTYQMYATGTRNMNPDIELVAATLSGSGTHFNEWHILPPVGAQSFPNSNPVSITPKVGITDVTAYYTNQAPYATVQFARKTTATPSYWYQAADDLSDDTMIYDNKPEGNPIYAGLVDVSNPLHLTTQADAESGARCARTRWHINNEVDPSTFETIESPVTNEYNPGDTISVVAAITDTGMRTNFVEWEITTDYGGTNQNTTIDTSNPLSFTLGAGVTRIVAVYKPVMALKCELASRDAQSVNDFITQVSGNAFAYIDNNCTSYNDIAADPDHYADGYIGDSCQVTPTNVTSDMVVHDSYFGYYATNVSPIKFFDVYGNNSRQREPNINFVGATRSGSTTVYDGYDANTNGSGYNPFSLQRMAGIVTLKTCFRN